MSRLHSTDSFLWENYIDRHLDPAEISRSCNDEDDNESGISESASDDAEGVDYAWGRLPDILLEEVFSYLSLRDRYHASIVCQHWYDVFYSPSLWRKLVMNSSSFTHQRYTAYKGYWSELSHHKVQMFLKKVGAFLQTIYIEPISEFYNLFEFVRIWNLFIEFHAPYYPMESLVNFHFAFCCENREQTDIFVYGTGGKLLEELTRLLSNLKKLEALTLNNLLLEDKDAHGVLDKVVANCGSTLRHLEIRNFTKELYPLFVGTMFRNLRTLVLSPQHLNSYIILRIAESEVTNFHIIQDHYCDDSYPVENETWKAVREKSPNLNVHLAACGQTAFDIFWQDGAPVTSVTYTTKFSKVFPVAVDTICVLYNTTLKVYGHYNLPRFHGSRAFRDRCDSDVVTLVRMCHRLHTLVIRDRISTATLIVIAREGKNLRKLHIRRSGLIKKCDWQRTLTWDDDYYWSMRRAAHDYESTFAEVSKCIGYKWQPLSDKAFMQLNPPHYETTETSDIDTT